MREYVAPFSDGYYSPAAHVGERLRQARLLAGLSQQKIADMEGITFQQVQKYESGANRISASRLVHLAHFLKMPIQWFFEGLNIESTMPGTLDTELFDQRETIELIRAYYGISDLKKRETGMNVLKFLVD